MGKKKARRNMQRIAQRVFNSELYVEPGYARRAMGFVGHELTGKEFIISAYSDEDDERLFQHPASERWQNANAENMGWMLRDDGTAVVRVEGSLYHGSSYSLDSSLGVGYNTIAANVEAALMDPNTERLALIWDSPGGEVNGCAACATRIRDMADRAGIPMWSFVDEGMFSAAYWIGSKADRIIMPAPAATASVGVVSTHVNYSQILEDRGMEITLITSGSKKVVGNPYEALSDEDFAEMQGRVMTYAHQFFDAVADSRPLTAKQVQAAEANIFIGQDAVDEGFADAIMDKDDFYYEFAKETNSTSIFTGTNAMNRKDLEALQDKASKADALIEENDTLKTSNDELKGEVKTLKGELKDAKEGASIVHDRYVAVMESDEASTRRTKAAALLADDAYAGFSAEKLQETLSQMQHDEDPDEDDDDSDEDDDEDDADGDGDEKEAKGKTAKMLAAARKKESDTDNITSKGPGDEGGESAEKKDKTYSAEPPKTREEHRAQMKSAAALVKQNKKRNHI